MIHLQCDNQSTKHDYSHLCTADEWWIHQPTTVTVVFHSLDWTQVLRKHWTTESAHQSEQNKQKSEGELQSSFDWLDASHLVPLVTLCIHCNFYDFFFLTAYRVAPWPQQTLPWMTAMFLWLMWKAGCETTTTTTTFRAAPLVEIKLPWADYVGHIRQGAVTTDVNPSVSCKIKKLAVSLKV